jgi:hypothetical protein
MTPGLLVHVKKRLGEFVARATPLAATAPGGAHQGPCGMSPRSRWVENEDRSQTVVRGEQEHERQEFAGPVWNKWYPAYSCRTLMGVGPVGCILAARRARCGVSHP